jgi:hyperosmotically inducible protein
MNIALLFLLVSTALLACPAVSSAQSPPATEPNVGAGQEVKDSWITSKTKMALVTDKQVKARRIKVETQRGVVTLRGKVASSEERDTAERITKGIDGVKSVRNTLEIVPEATRKASDTKDDELIKAVRTRLDTDEKLKDASIRVRADNGMVTLMGTVPSARVKDRAVEMARKVPGVRAVRNELQLKS